jgi:dihydroorotate dehydrogenase electron transfer subunit
VTLLNSWERHTRRKVEVTRVIDETPGGTREVKTLYVRDPFPRGTVIEPGQFVMAWVPGIDEIPIAICEMGEELALTIYAMGDCSKALCAMRPGARFALRGPLGRGFTFPRPGERLLMVGGGTGTASLAPLADALKDTNRTIFVLGARTRGDLILRYRLEKTTELRISTDDGSDGFHGYSSDLAAQVIDSGEVDVVYTCGPEPMMKKVVENALSKGMPVEASVERYMKCAMGLCDACAVGPKHVCIDGPVFQGADLATWDAFGRFHRSKSGVRQAW